MTTQDAIAYNIYRNDGSGGPIDYATPVASTSSTSWASGPLAAPGQWKFGVRAARLADGLEEKNLDAAVAISLGDAGADLSGRPAGPSGLRAFPRANGAIRVEWGYLTAARARSPLGFHVYLGAGGSPDYSAPVASTPYSLGRASYLCDLPGLVHGTRYAIGVRAYNGAGEEANTSTVQITSDAIGPQGVDILTATPTAQQGD